MALRCVRVRSAGNRQELLPASRLEIHEGRGGFVEARNAPDVCLRCRIHLAPARESVDFVGASTVPELCRSVRGEAFPQDLRILYICPIHIYTHIYV